MDHACSGFRAANASRREPSEPVRSALNQVWAGCSRLTGWQQPVAPEDLYGLASLFAWAGDVAADAAVIFEGQGVTVELGLCGVDVATGVSRQVHRHQPTAPDASSREPAIQARSPSHGIKRGGTPGTATC